MGDAHSQRSGILVSENCRCLGNLQQADLLRCSFGLSWAPVWLLIHMRGLTRQVDKPAIPRGRATEKSTRCYTELYLRWPQQQPRSRLGSKPDRWARHSRIAYGLWEGMCLSSVFDMFKNRLRHRCSVHRKLGRRMTLQPCPQQVDCKGPS